jgi:hypothetical protein
MTVVSTTPGIMTGLQITSAHKMIGWEGWKLPDNWKEILEDEIEKADRYFSRLIEESNESEETKELARQWVDQEIDKLRRGTFFTPDIEKKLL